LPLFGTPSLTVGNLAPLFLFAYPLTDLITAVIRRLMRGKSPFLADRAHLHHRISDVGMTQPQAVGILLTVSFFLALIGAVLSAGLLWAGSMACAVTASVMLLIRHRITRAA
jgi:UDP-GlcNAc:undecaprenyl-phosphate GlcNAc-1-phosphate transferase